MPRYTDVITQYMKQALLAYPQTHYGQPLPVLEEDYPFLTVFLFRAWVIRFSKAGKRRIYIQGPWSYSIRESTRCFK